MTAFLPSARLLSYDGERDELVLHISPRDRDLATQVPGFRFRKQDETWRAKPYLSVGLACRGVFGQALDVDPAVYDRLQPEVDLCSTVRAVKDGEQHPAEDDPRLTGLLPPQKDASFLAALRGGFIIGDEKGSGKTVEAAGALNIAHAPYPALVVCTNSMKYQWQEELEKWCNVPVAVAGRTPTQRKAAISAVKEGAAEVLVMSWEQLRLHSSLAPYGSLARSDAEKEPKELQEVPFRTVIADECVPDTTLIPTPFGDVPISWVGPGDLVLGVDHSTGESVWTEVKAVMTSPDRELVQVGDLWVTPEHPVWVSDSLCYASLHAKDSAHRQDLRVVRDPVSGDDSQASLLLQEVFVLEPCYSRVSGGITEEDAPTSGAGGRAGEVECSPERSDQSVQEPRGAGPSGGYSAKAGLPDADRREWSGSYRPAADLVRSHAGRVGDGTPDTDSTDPSGVPVVLQGGHWEQRPEGGCGGAWEQPQGPRSEGRGPEEAGVSPFSWLGRVRGVGRGRNGRPLWNLETATGNYVADGVLVHNCHRGKNPKAKSTRALWSVAHSPTCAHRWALTATPVAGHTVDLWGILHFIAPEEFPSRSKFIDRYVRIFENPWGGIEDMGLRPDTEDEFRQVFEPRFIRRPLRLPVEMLPVQHRFVDMEGKQRTVYKQLEKESLARVDGRFLVAVGPLMVNTRLQQLAQGTPVLDKEGNVTALSLPSCKYDALLDVLDEMGGEPLVVFSHSRLLLELCLRELTEGRGARFKPEEVGRVFGGIDPQERQRWISEFQEGRLPLILCSIGAGSEGITLTRASTMVFLNRSFRQVSNNQAEGRLLRHGQTRNVQIIDIIARESEELRVYESAALKDARLQAVVQDEDWEERVVPSEAH